MLPKNTLCSQISIVLVLAKEYTARSNSETCQIHLLNAIVMKMSLGQRNLNRI